MKLAAALLLCALSARAGSLDVFHHVWSVPNPADWGITEENGTQIVRLETSRGPLPGPRRPIQFALADVPSYNRLNFEADMMPLGRSVLIVFAYRDEAHFDYAHLSRDTGAEQSVHNGVFHVYGGERVRISSERGPAAFPEGARWYHVLLAHDASTGKITVQVDGKSVPALEAVDLSLGAGRAGFGSFDETGSFRNVKISAE